MTVRFVARLVRCFVGSTRAVAAIEFAVVLPMLAVVFMGCFDGGRAVVAYMKVRAATYVLASITNQYATIASSDMTDILGAASVVMAPYNSGTPKVTVSQIKISGTGTATIGWSAAQGATARSVGSSISPPAAIKVNGSYLVFAEISYTYAPLFGLFGSGGITFSRQSLCNPATCFLYRLHPAKLDLLKLD